MRVISLVLHRYIPRYDIPLSNPPLPKHTYTYLLAQDDPWLATDTVFAVKDDLVVDFKPLEKLPSNVPEHQGPGGAATRELELDIVLAPLGAHASNAKPLL